MIFQLVPLTIALLAMADPPAPPAISPQDIVSALESIVADSIEKVQPSVVAVTRIKSQNGETTAIRGRNPEPLPIPDAVELGFQGGGALVNPKVIRPGFPNADPQLSPEYFALPGDFASGVVIGDHGEILTVYHLLRGAARIRVRGGGEEFDAEIIAADPRIDLAVIAPRERPGPAPKLKPIAIGNSDKLRQGSFLIALGNPYNSARDGKASASLGILSNLSRRVEPPLTDDPNIRQYFRFQPTLLQLDSKLNLGMSGGAVVNLKGELVGLTTSASSPSGFDAEAGYAIPMDALGRRAVERLVKGEEVEYGFIGIGLDRRIPNGVGSVQKGTPADHADLVSGDIILAVGGTQLTDDESALPLALASVPVGEPVTLKVLHNGEIKERTLVMSKYPVQGDVIATVRPKPWRGARIDFTSVLSDRPDTEATLQAMSRGGVGVVEVESGSPADSAGLSRGLVITEVEGKRVATPGEFREAVAGLEGKPVTVTTVNGLEVGKKITIEPK